MKEGAKAVEEEKLRKPGPLRIGNLTVDPPLVLAPMAGVTDASYRRVMEEHGAGMTTTEMVSVEGLRRDDPKTRRLLHRDNSRSPAPLAVQIFGRDLQAVAEGARRVEGHGAFLVDINAGCPVRKVARQGAGAALLKTPGHLARMVEEVRKVVGLPVTVKLRLGWDASSINVVEVSRLLERAGADAVTVHARTATQLYAGKADWSWIRKVKEAVKIPVVGNGDVTSPLLADQFLGETGCDGVMVGRATMGNPWLLAAIAHGWDPLGSARPEPDWPGFLETVRGHALSLVESRPRSPGLWRKLLVWYSKGCPGASRLRGKLMELDRWEAMWELFEQWTERLAESSFSPLDAKLGSSKR